MACDGKIKTVLNLFLQFTLKFPLTEHFLSQYPSY